GRPDARQARDLRHVRAVEIDALPGEEWARQARGGPGGVTQTTARRRVDGDQAHVSGCRRRLGGEGVPRAGAREGEEREEEGGAAVVHDCRLTARPPTYGIRSTRGAPENCRAVEGG